MLLIVVLCCASLLFHELGHAHAMGTLGIRVAEFGVGWPSRFQRRFLAPKWLGRFIILVSPIPTALYVRPTKSVGLARMDSLVYEDQAYVSGMGPLAQVAFGLVLSLTAIPLLCPVSANSLTAMLCVGMVLAVTWHWQRMICRFMLPVVLPFLGILFAVAMSLVGILLVIILDRVDLSWGRSTGVECLVAAAFSIGFGIGSLLPVPPHDGVRIFDRWATDQAFSARGRSILQIAIVVWAAISMMATLWLPVHFHLEAPSLH